MGEDRKMYVVTIEQRKKATATAGREVTTETFGIQATQRATPEDDNTSNHGGVI